MKTLLLASGLIFITTTAAVSGIENDSIPGARVSGLVQVSNMGFAPVPAFSFNSPIVIGFMSVKRKRFSFEPDAAASLNGKPWMTNNWFRVALPQQKVWRATLGLNPSLFFKNEKQDTAGGRTITLKDEKNKVLKEWRF